MPNGMLLGMLLLSALRLHAQQGPAVPKAGAGQNAPADSEVLRRLEADYLRAEIEDDTAIASAILADDYVGLKLDGTSTTKAEILGRLSRHDRQRQPYMITATDMQEHLFGDSACVTYIKVYSRPGAPTAYRETVLHMLTRRNGIWRLQLSSPLPPPK